MDLKANPCKDFYKYSCGGWLDRTAIPDSKTRYSIFTELATKNQQSIKFEIAKIIGGQVNVSVSCFHISYSVLVLLCQHCISHFQCIFRVEYVSEWF